MRKSVKNDQFLIIKSPLTSHKTTPKTRFKNPQIRPKFAIKTTTKYHS